MSNGDGEPETTKGTLAATLNRAHEATAAIRAEGFALRQPGR